jgi:hypothetical protein
MSTRAPRVTLMGGLAAAERAASEKEARLVDAAEVTWPHQNPPHTCAGVQNDKEAA